MIGIYREGVCQLYGTRHADLYLGWERIRNICCIRTYLLCTWAIPTHHRCRRPLIALDKRAPMVATTMLTRAMESLWRGVSLHDSNTSFPPGPIIQVQSPLASHNLNVWQ